MDSLLCFLKDDCVKKKLLAYFTLMNNLANFAGSHLLSIKLMFLRYLNHQNTTVNRFLIFPAKLFFLIFPAKLFFLFFSLKNFFLFSLQNFFHVCPAKLFFLFSLQNFFLIFFIFPAKLFPIFPAKLFWKTGLQVMGFLRITS